MSVSGICDNDCFGQADLCHRSVGSLMPGRGQQIFGLGSEGCLSAFGGTDVKTMCAPREKYCNVAKWGLTADGGGSRDCCLGTAALPMNFAGNSFFYERLLLSTFAGSCVHSWMRMPWGPQVNLAFGRGGAGRNSEADNHQNTTAHNEVGGQGIDIRREIFSSGTFAIGVVGSLPSVPIAGVGCFSVLSVGGSCHESFPGGTFPIEALSVLPLVPRPGANVFRVPSLGPWDGAGSVDTMPGRSCLTGLGCRAWGGTFTQTNVAESVAASAHVHIIGGSSALRFETSGATTSLEVFAACELRGAPGARSVDAWGFWLIRKVAHDRFCHANVYGAAFPIGAPTIFPTSCALGIVSPSIGSIGRVNHTYETHRLASTMIFPRGVRGSCGNWGAPNEIGMGSLGQTRCGNWGGRRALRACCPHRASHLPPTQICILNQGRAGNCL